jgi:hypothetical protein
VAVHRVTRDGFRRKVVPQERCDGSGADRSEPCAIRLAVGTKGPPDAVAADDVRGFVVPRAGVGDLARRSFVGVAGAIAGSDGPVYRPDGRRASGVSGEEAVS